MEHSTKNLKKTLHQRNKEKETRQTNKTYNNERNVKQTFFAVTSHTDQVFKPILSLLPAQVNQSIKRSPFLCISVDGKESTLGPFLKLSGNCRINLNR